MTLIFAHRGYSSLYPENTMVAFREAEQVNADGIEIDIQMTKDGELVIIHDEKVDRTTNGKGMVKDFTYSQIRRLDASANFKEGTINSPIPSLKELFEWMQDNSIICNIELKNNRIDYKGMEEKMIVLIREFNLSERIIISSFNHYSLVYCHQIAPDIETAPLLSNGIYQPWIYAHAIKAKSFHPNYKKINEELIRKAAQYKVKVRPYTVNCPTQIKKFVDAGISGIITDEPALAKEIISRS